MRRAYPEIYQRLLTTVKPERDANNRAAYRDNWWIFGEPRKELRSALQGLARYIVTVETAKHRVFQFMDASVMPDNKLVCLALEEPVSLGIVQSRIHAIWYLANAGMIGVFDQPAVYVKTSSFDPFPFPDTTHRQRLMIGDLAEELDATRKNVLAEHPDLTLTGLYNLRDKLRRPDPFSASEEDRRRRGRVDIIDELHNRIDAAVADAYGWSGDLTDEQIVLRLVALNAERYAEEKAGWVRWLRADYQIARTGITVLAPKKMAQQIEAALPATTTRKPTFPRDAIGQTAAVLAELRGGAGLTGADIARRYAQGLRSEPRIAATLAALVRLGHAADEQGRYTLRRAA